MSYAPGIMKFFYQMLGIDLFNPVFIEAEFLGTGTTPGFENL